MSRNVQYVLIDNDNNVINKKLEHLSYTNEPDYKILKFLSQNYFFKTYKAIHNLSIVSKCLQEQKINICFVFKCTYLHILQP